MEYTQEQRDDFTIRAKAFSEALEALKKEHQVELVHAVVTVPGPGGIFGLMVNESIGDTKYKPVPSPFSGIDGSDSASEDGSKES